MILTRLMRLVALCLIPAVLSNNLAIAQNKPMKPAAVKAKLEERGVGRGVRITLVDKTELKGLIVSIGDESCTVNTKGPDQPQTVAYSQITGVHKDKMSTGTKVGIAVGVVGVTVAVLVAVGAYMLTHFH